MKYQQTLAFWPLRAVLRSSLTPGSHPRGIQTATHCVIPHSWKVFHTPTSNEYNGMFLQIVPLASNIRGHFHSIRQPHAGHFAKRGIRLFRRRRIHTSTYPSPLRTALQRWNAALRALSLPRFPNKLIDRCHPITTLIRQTCFR